MNLGSKLDEITLNKVTIKKTGSIEWDHCHEIRSLKIFVMNTTWIENSEKLYSDKRSENVVIAKQLYDF